MDKMEEVDSRSRMLTNGGGPDQAGQVYIHQHQNKYIMNPESD